MNYDLKRKEKGKGKEKNESKKIKSIRSDMHNHNEHISLTSVDHKVRLFNFDR